MNILKTTKTKSWAAFAISVVFAMVTAAPAVAYDDNGAPPEDVDSKISDTET